MNKNIVIPVVLVLAVLGVVMYMSKGSPQSTAPVAMEQITPTETPTPTKKPFPKPPVKGEVFANSEVKDLAHEVWPGKQTAEALVATKGWTIKSTMQKNGMTLVEFIPSEQVDKKSSYTVKKGETLYFVEVNPGDDSEEVDKFLQDDFGVIVGPDGLVQ